jgi:Transglutaminase-like superfamily
LEKLWFERRRGALVKLCEVGSRGGVQVFSFKMLMLQTKAMLRLVPFERVAGWAKSPLSKAATRVRACKTEEARPREISRVVRLVQIAARRGPLKSACLVRSLVLIRALSEIGVESSLRIGVNRTDDGGFAAHAWVEIDGVPVNDKPDIRSLFATFERLDSTALASLGAAPRS